MVSSPFRFKKFEIRQTDTVHPLGTDAVLIGAWPPLAGVRKALDIGTGTGIIALMLAQRREDIKVDAIDIHEDAVECARENIRRSPWHDRIHVWQSAVQTFEGGPYDLIVSNPPFFSETIMSPDLHRRRARTAISLKTTDLLEHTCRLLAPQGSLCLIMPPVEGQRLLEIAATIGLYTNRMVEVHTTISSLPERLLLQFSRNPYQMKRASMTLLDAEGGRSADFYRLTKEFYLDKKR